MRCVWGLDAIITQTQSPNHRHSDDESVTAFAANESRSKKDGVAKAVNNIGNGQTPILSAAAVISSGTFVNVPTDIQALWKSNNTFVEF